MIVAFLAVTSADAHITLTFPQTRYGDPNIQKDGMCGRGAQDQRSVNNVTTFVPGETITITWTETVNHTSHFRLSFDDDGADFLNPPEEDAYFSNPLVFADNIPDDPAQTYSVSYTFPLIECSNCTLQLIQVMQDDPNYNPNDDIYFQCADIELAYLGDTDDTDLPGDTDVQDTDVVDTDPPVDTDPQDTDTTPPPAGDDDDDGDDDGGCMGGCSGTGVPASLGVGLIAVGLVAGRRRQQVR
jgi:MYXO-CTERM domain-containing protein